MNLLLDTHALLWWDSEPDRLSSRALSACEEPANSVYFSHVSIWEIQIKAQLGKLKLGRPVRAFVEALEQIGHLGVLPIRLEHLLHLEGLPQHHKDPFDRLLISQALVEQMTLVSNDKEFDSYNVLRFW